MFSNNLREDSTTSRRGTNFIDDIVVFGINEAEQKVRLNKVLNILKQNNVLLNEDKCIYKAKIVHFLGHEVPSDSLKPLDKYTKIIKTFREPSSIVE